MQESDVTITKPLGCGSGDNFTQYTLAYQQLDGSCESFKLFEGELTDGKKVHVFKSDTIPGLWQQKLVRFGIENENVYPPPCKSA